MSINYRSKYRRVTVGKIILAILICLAFVPVLLFCALLDAFEEIFGNEDERSN